MDQFQSFVPTSLLDRVLAGRGDAPIEAAFTGAALFADINDYTALAERLCAAGPEGIEQLGRFLDQAFRRYVDCVHETGGEVACFAGDALLAYWPEPGDAASAVACATECARLLHNASTIDRPGDMNARTLHIGVGCGDLWAARLGGVDGRWHLLLSGDAVREANDASISAGPGQTTMGARVRDYVGDTATVLRESSARRSATAHDFKVGDFVPRVVQEWVGGGLQEWLPQFRSICALSLRIDGLECGSSRRLSMFQEAISAVMMAIRPFTGSGGTLLDDDKGLVLKLCLGLPHDSHVDDAVRAVRAGLVIERELERLGLRAAAGVAAGRGLCMPVGGSERQHYIAIGRFMHVAARLMQHAGAGMLCTDEIAERVRGECTLSPEGRAELKGLPSSLRIFRVRDVPRHDERAERLFGREFEQRQLASHLDALQRGKGRVVWLSGEAGIGKTALVRELVKDAEQRELACFLGGAASVDAAIPHLAWRPIFSALLEVESDTASAPARAERLRGLRNPQLAPLVNAVIPGFVEENEAVERLAGDARADAMLRVLSEIIGLAAPRPFMLVLEDCHWMDSASWRLLLRVAQDYPEVLLVLTARPGVPLRELESLRRLERFVELNLSPLRKDAVAQLVEDLLESDRVSPALIDDIIARSACNPLFVREYTLLLESTQPVVHGHATPGRALVSRHSTDALPATVEGLIASRLDALTPDEDLVLKGASVLGDQFRTELLRGMFPGEEGHQDLASTLASLVRKDLIVEAGAYRRVYAFRHALIRQGAYEQLTQTQRRALHRAAAATIEQHYKEDVTPHVGSLAHHWFRANAPELAIGYADAAAAQALAAGAYLEADRLLKVCIEHSYGDVGKTEALVRWLRQAAEARRGTGQLESRAAAAREALARAGRRRPSTQIGLALQGAMRAGRLYLRHVIPALRPRKYTPFTLEIAQAYRHSAEVCYFNNDMVGMICDSISSVECAEAAPPSAVLASASTELGGVLAIAGFRRIGERILAHAIQVAATAGDQAALAYAHLVSSLYAVGTGDWRNADRSARFCQTLCVPMDDTVNWTNAQAIRFWVAHYQGQLDVAGREAQQLLDRARETGNRQHQAWSLRYLAQCNLRHGRAADAVQQLTSALDRLGETAALNERIPAIALLALGLLRTGEVWAARAKARDGLALIAQVKRPIGHSLLEGYSALAEVVFDAWRTDPAASDWRREARLCLRVLHKYRAAFPIGAPREWLWRARFDELEGRTQAARSKYERSIGSAERFGMPWEQTVSSEALRALEA